MLRLTLTGLFLLLAAFTVSAQTVQVVNLQTNDLVYDPFSAKIYASVPSSAGSNGNSIVAIDPAAGTIGSPVSIGSEPNKLALSDDGQFLYVGLDGANAVQRFDLRTQSAEPPFSVADKYNAFVAGAIAVLPQHPHDVAVMRNIPGLDPPNMGIVIYVDGVARPNMVGAGAHSFDAMTFGSSMNRLYGSSGSAFIRMNVDANGVSIADAVSRLVAGPIQFDKTSKAVYSPWGQAADPETETSLGFLSVPWRPFSGIDSRFAVLPDTANGRIFLLRSDIESSSVDIAAFDSTTFLPLGSLIIPGALTGTTSNPITSFIKVGGDELAFRNNNGQVFLVSGLDFPGLASFTVNADTIQGGTAVSAVVTLSRPAPPSGLTVYMASDNGTAIAAPYTLFFPAGTTTQTVTLPSMPVVASQHVTLTIGYGTQRIAVPMTVLDKAADPVLPANIRVVNLPANDLVYDPHMQRLYASVPSIAGSLGNSVTAVDPVSGTVGSSVFVGSEPNPLAVSDDEQFLYVGLDGANAVRRIDLASLTAGPQFPLGFDNFLTPNPVYAGQIVVLAGQPHSIAVSRRDGYGYSPSFDGLAIYDDGVPRPHVEYGGVDAVITPSANASRLYGYDNESDPSTFYQLDVDSTGVKIHNFLGNLRSYFGTIKYDAGTVYSSAGLVLDPESLTLRGTFPGLAFGGPIQPASDEGRVYILDIDIFGNSPLRIFDPATFQQIEALPMPNINSPFGSYASLTRWGTYQLALRTASGQIFLIDTSPTLLASVAVDPMTVEAAAVPQGTVQLTNVAPLGDLTVSLSSDTPTAASVPATITVPAGSKNVTFPITTYPVASTTPVTITATYGSVSTQTKLSVTKAHTTLTTPANLGAWAIGVTLNPPLTAVLKRHADGAPLVGQSVTFKTDGAVLGTATTDATGTATQNYTIPTSASLGKKTITAEFAGGDYYYPSAASAALTVQQKTDTLVTVANATGTRGRSVLLRALLRRKPDGTPVPGKTLTFQVAGATVGTATTAADGNASVTYSLPANLDTGSRPITVTLPQDNLYLASSGTATLTVQADTLITVANATASVGHPVLLRALLRQKPDGAVVTGETLTFQLGGLVVGTAVTGSDGLAKLNYTPPAGIAGGNQSLSVTFAQDDNYNASSATGTLTIHYNTLVTVASASGKAGQTVLLRALLRRYPDGLRVSGETLTFRLNGTSVGTATTGSDGLAVISYTIPANAASSNPSITVAFMGDGNYQPATGAGTLTVNP